MTFLWNSDGLPPRIKVILLKKWYERVTEQRELCSVVVPFFHTRKSITATISLRNLLKSFKHWMLKINETITLHSSLDRKTVTQQQNIK